MDGRPAARRTAAADQAASAGADAAVEAALADRGAPRYSISQASELLGVTPWFLRRLDTLDVVKPSRSGGAQRRYSRDQLTQVADAKALMDDGVSTVGVRRVLELQARVSQLEAELARARGRGRLRRKGKTPPAPSS